MFSFELIPCFLELNVLDTEIFLNHYHIFKTQMISKQDIWLKRFNLLDFLTYYRRLLTGYATYFDSFVFYVFAYLTIKQPHDKT